MNRFMNWWYAISLPTHPAITPRERERIRYARLTSAFLLFTIFSYLPAGPSMILTSPHGSLIPLVAILMLVALLAAFFLGKQGWNIPSALCVIVYYYLVVNGVLVTAPLDPSLLPILFALVFTVILAGALLPPIAAIIVAIVNSVTILLMSAFQPHTAAYTAMMQNGLYMVSVYLPIILQLGVAIMIFVVMRNLIQTIRRADRAEEIVALQEEMAEYEQERAIQQAQLEEGFRRIAEVHARIANGDLSARVSLDEGSVLWAIAVPLNNLLNRLQDWRQQVQDLSQTKRAAQYIAEQLHTAILSRKSVYLPPTGTLLDPIIIEINQVIQLTSAPYTKDRNK